MALPVIPLAGQLTYSHIVINWIANGANNAQVHLFSNNLEILPTTTLANFVGVTNPGLTPQPTPVAINDGPNNVGQYVWRFAPITFTAAGGPYPLLVWGYWIDVVDPVTGLQALLWAQSFPTGVAFLRNGDSYTFNLFQVFGTCTPNTTLEEHLMLEKARRGRKGR